MKKLNQKGITLIALVVTIIILIILAGISISLLLGDNGIITKAQLAGNTYNFAALKEKLQLEILNIRMENMNMTASEIIDKLKEANVINNNLQIVENTEYSISYNGNIMDSSGKVVDTFKIQGDSAISELEVPVPSTAGSMISGATCTIKCVNGSITQNPEGNDETVYGIIPNQAPIGYKFSYWIDKFNNIVSYSTNQYLRTIVDNVYTSVYVRSDMQVDKQICVNVYASNTQTRENELQFMTMQTSDLNLSDYELTVGGLITNIPELANENDMVISRSNDTSAAHFFYNVSMSCTTDDNSYSLAKSNVGSYTWYYRGYTTVKKKSDNSTQTYYSNIISIKK